MHCCMWSNMKKKKNDFSAVPQSLINDLESKEKPSEKDNSKKLNDDSDSYIPPKFPGQDELAE